MAETIYVNDHDLEADLGLTDVSITELNGWGAGIEYRRTMTAIPGAFGATAAPDSAMQPRRLRITARLDAGAVASRDAELSELLDAFTGLVEMRFGDSIDKVLEALVDTESSVGESGISFVNPELLVTLDLVCPDPAKRDRYLQSIAGAAAARVSIPLGTLPSHGVIYIMGAATNPTLTYRDSGGNSIQTMAFTVTLGTTEYLAIDLTLKTVKKYTAGVESDALSTWTGGSPSGGFIVPDPQHGSYASSSWPTLETSTGSLHYAYHRRWRS